MSKMTSRGLRATLIAATLCAALAQAAEPRDYALPGAPLAATLTRIATDAGLVLSIDPALVGDRQSHAVQGRYEPEQALRAALQGSGLTLVRGESGVLTLAELRGGDATLLQAVKVQAEVSNMDPGRTEGSRGYAAPSTNTAFKLPLTPRETPQTVTVVPQAIIQDFGLTDIRQIMLFAPGVAASAERGPQSYYFESRGNSLQVQYDGVPSSNRFGGRGAGMTFDAATIDRVEILHGASGLLTGPGKPGGTVNVIRKLPTEQAQVAIEAGGNSWGGWRGTADVAGPLGDTGFGGRLVAVYERQDFYIDYADAKHSVLYGVIGRKFGENTELYAGVNLEQVADGSYGSHYGLPANMDGSSRDIPRKKNLGATWSDTDESLNTAFVRLRHAFSADWSLHGMLTYEDYDTSQLEGNAGVPRDPEQLDKLYLFAAIENWKADTMGLDLYLQGAFELFGRKHELMTGFNGLRRREAGDYSNSPQPLAEIDIATWDARQAPGPYSQGINFVYGYTGEYEQYGAFGGARFSLADPLHLIVGTRLSWVEQQRDGVTDSKEQSVSTFYSGLVWDVSKLLSVYTSYSDIFEPHPVYVRDSSGKVLDPITGENLEVGLKLEAFDGKLNGALALFRLDQDNLAQADYEGALAGICGGEALDPCSRASGRVRNEGFELSLSGQLARGWQIYGGYTNFKRKYKTEDGGDPYAQKMPAEYLHLATNYSAADEQWSVGASARWQETVAYNGTLFFLPSQSFSTRQSAYTVVGLFGSYRLTPRFKLNAAVDNLFDKQYFSGLEWPLGGMVYGDARQFSLTLRAEF